MTCTVFLKKYMRHLNKAKVFTSSYEEKEIAKFTINSNVFNISLRFQVETCTYKYIIHYNKEHILIVAILHAT